MTIQHIRPGSRMSQAVIGGGLIFLAGQVGEGAGVAAQTRSVLAKIDGLLAEAGASKDRLLSANIWLADIASFEEMNAVWDEWIADAAAPPARATVEAKLARPDLLVEIAVVALATEVG